LETFHIVRPVAGFLPRGFSGVLSCHAHIAHRSHSCAEQWAGLLHPTGALSFVELVTSRTSAFDVSCFPNAFRNAAVTLLERIKEHGADDPSVRQWTIGEDAVLANCASDSPLPIDVPDTPAWLKDDRAYQIATAYFYRFDYGRAAELYAAIGADAASSWRKLARYLAARAAVHAAIVAQTPESIAVAEAAIAGIAAEELADYHADAPRLASMLAFATQPQQRAQELAKSLLGADLPASLAFDLHDLVDLERTGKRYSDVGAWIYDINALNGEEAGQAAAKADVLARWHDSRTLPWLVAAIFPVSFRKRVQLRPIRGGDVPVSICPILIGTEDSCPGYPRLRTIKGGGRGKSLGVSRDHW
jgi:hypothetical protein